MIALRVLHGLPVKSSFGRDLIRKCTGRDPSKLPSDGFNTALFLTGRRSGKSRIAAVIGAYEAALSGREKHLAKGEQGLVPVVCPTKRQGVVVRNYLRALFEPPMLKAEVVSERQQDAFELRNGVRIEILPGDFRHTRGYTLISVICDEIAFFGLDEDSRVRSDTELIRALQPALATCNGRLICIGSPYARKGYCWNTFSKHFGINSSSILCWNAASRTMNSTLPQKVVDQALAEDLQAAKSEYLGEFRDDVLIFISPELIANLVVRGRQENLRHEGNRYFAFADLSGGRNDASALAIAHKEGRKVVLDALDYHPSPHNPHIVIQHMIGRLREWGIRKVTADAYSAEFAAAPFRDAALIYDKCKKTASQLYAEILPVLCSSSVELLDHPRLIKQLASLERRTRSGGKDVIDHPPGGHDDLANAVAGVAELCSAKRLKVGLALT